MRIFKKTIVFVLILVVLLGCAVGCGRAKSSKDESEGASKDAVDMFFCKASDFESIQNQWEIGEEPKLQKIHTSELVVNEDYYFICSFSPGAWSGFYELDLGVKTWGNLFYNSETVTIQRDDTVAEESVKVQFDREGNLDGVFSKYLKCI